MWKIKKWIDRLLSKHFCLQPFFIKDWVSLQFAKLGSFNIWVSRSLENAFPTHFLTWNDIWSMADKHHFSPWILWFSDKIHEIPSTRSVHKSLQQTLYGCLVCGSYHFFCNQTWPGHSVMISSDLYFLSMSKHCSISVIYS